MKWYRLQRTPPYLCVQLKSTHYEHSITANRTRFIFTDISSDDISSERSSLLFYWCSLVTWTFSALVWLASGAESKLACASEKSPVHRCGHKGILHLNKQYLSRKNEAEAAVVSGVANPIPAPALTALNIFNAVKLGKLITCVNAPILTALLWICNIYWFYYAFYWFLSLHNLLVHVSVRTTIVKDDWQLAYSLDWRYGSVLGKTSLRIHAA